MRRQPDLLTIAALGFIVFMIFNVLRDQGIAFATIAPVNAANAMQKSILPTPEEGQITTIAQSFEDQDAIAPPYDSYTLTQGPHGQSYGQLAIDIAAGKGTEIKSPINGNVTALYVDDLGNTTLVIENDHYQVTMLHGIFTVKLGDHIKLGQGVGTESNQGNTVDGLGRSCRGRDCGYHLHLNIYDKRLGANVNPLDLFSR
jgi:murein DD-endopeptidase MepM/ murein hydrolase activator NlpD